MYNCAKNYMVPLIENNGKIVYIKAFSVNDILSSKIGRENIDLSPEYFPHNIQENLQLLKSSDGSHNCSANHWTPYIFLKVPMSFLKVFSHLILYFLILNYTGQFYNV